VAAAPLDVLWILTAVVRRILKWRVVMGVVVVLLVEARVRLSVILVIVVVRRTQLLTRVVRLFTRCFLNMLAHAHIATLMMIRPVPTHVLLLTI
jgi:hypothetical protein